jgi:hypothetical protein
MACAVLLHQKPDFNLEQAQFGGEMVLKLEERKGRQKTSVFSLCGQKDYSIFNRKLAKLIINLL